MESILFRMKSLARTTFCLGVATTALSSLNSVDVGHRAVVVNRYRGVLEDTIDAGIHFRIPWIEKSHIFDVRRCYHQMNIKTTTKDLQMADMRLHIIFHPDITKLPVMVKKAYDKKTFPEIVSEVIKDTMSQEFVTLVNEVLPDVISQVKAEEFLTNNSWVCALVRDGLIRRSEDFNIAIDDVALLEVVLTRNRA
ncbi:hypothetical protein V8G54_025834 [Vigna mungo]|uniref:Prohibitin n=1 Tax=Vigna mungo TaxID=3915 RepID=A0AAQ3MZQ0_VIGMU